MSRSWADPVHPSRYSRSGTASQPKRPRNVIATRHLRRCSSRCYADTLDQPMKCPGCSANFPLTWRRYVTAPSGKYRCPVCGASLRIQHQWWHRPLLSLGCCAFGVPAALIVGSYFGSWAGKGAWILGGLISGIPFDKFLESRYAILHVQQRLLRTAAVRRRGSLARIIAAILLGFLAMVPLAAVFTTMDWPAFNGWGLAHGSFVIAWPLMSLCSYWLCGYLPAFKHR